MLVEKETTLTWGDYVDYSDADIVLAGALEGYPEVPLVIVPISGRAVATFIRWGMLEEGTGIAPPYDAMDLVNSIPRNWIIKSVDMKVGVHVITEVPLPQKLHVVH